MKSLPSHGNNLASQHCLHSNSWQNKSPALEVPQSMYEHDRHRRNYWRHESKLRVAGSLKSTLFTFEPFRGKKERQKSTVEADVPFSIFSANTQSLWP